MFRKRWQALFAVIAIMATAVGCVTVERTENGTKFFSGADVPAGEMDAEAQRDWDLFRHAAVMRLRDGRGRLNMDEVRKFLPAPAIERDTGDLKAWGWYFQENRSKSWDLAIVNGSTGIDRLYLLTTVFTAEGTLKSYEEERRVVPLHRRGVTTRPIVEQVVVYQNMLTLSRLIEASLNRAGDRAVERLDDRLKETMRREGNDFLERLKESGSELNEKLKELLKEP